MCWGVGSKDGSCWLRRLSHPLIRLSWSRFGIPVSGDKRFVWIFRKGARICQLFVLCCVGNRRSLNIVSMSMVSFQCEVKTAATSRDRLLHLPVKSPPPPCAISRSPATLPPPRASPVYDCKWLTGLHEHDWLCFFFRPIGWMWTRLFCPILSLEFEVRDEQRLVSDKPCIIVCNHQSSLDVIGTTPVILSVFSVCNFTSQKSLLRRKGHSLSNTNIENEDHTQKKEDDGKELWIPLGDSEGKIQKWEGVLPLNLEGGKPHQN